MFTGNILSYGKGGFGEVHSPEDPKGLHASADTKEELAHKLAKLIPANITFEEFKSGYKETTEANEDGVKSVYGEYSEGGNTYHFAVTDEQGKTVSLFD